MQGYGGNYPHATANPVPKAWDPCVCVLLLELLFICSIILFKRLCQHVSVFPVKQMDHSDHTVWESQVFLLTFMKHWRFPVEGQQENVKHYNYSWTSVGSSVDNLYCLSQAGDEVRMFCSQTVEEASFSDVCQG